MSTGERILGPDLLGQEPTLGNIIRAIREHMRKTPLRGGADYFAIHRADLNAILDVAERVRDGVDPWNGNYFGGSRKVSQALGRLRRKGFVNYGYLPKPREDEVGYFLTELGVSWLGGGKDRAP